MAKLQRGQIVQHQQQVVACRRSPLAACRDRMSLLLLLLLQVLSAAGSVFTITLLRRRRS
jgi:hypothetical protein